MSRLDEAANELVQYHDPRSARFECKVFPRHAFWAVIDHARDAEDLAAALGDLANRISPLDDGDSMDAEGLRALCAELCEIARKVAAR